MFCNLQKGKGFTILELMVVITTIAILTSITLSALTTARLKGRDTAIKNEVRQMRILMQQSFSDTGTFAGVQTQSWITGSGDCSVYVGTYAAQAKQICLAIVSLSLSSGSGYLWSGTALLGSDPNQNKYYSIMAYLPGKGAFFCMGSNGQNTDTGTASSPTPWSQPGCYGDANL